MIDIAGPNWLGQPMMLEKLRHQRNGLLTTMTMLETLAAIEVCDALIFPAKRLPKDSPQPHLALPVLDARYSPIQEAELARNYGRFRSRSSHDINPYSTKSEIDTFSEERALYGGFLSGHYGHFILESLARLWATDDQYRNERVLFHSNKPVMSKMQKYCLNIAGFDERRVQIVDRPLRIKRLIVPESGFVISSLFHPQHAKFLAKIPSGNKPGNRIWLSRSKLPDEAGRVVDEADLEGEISKDGWNVVHPETLSLVDQARVLANASVVAGLEGSAFHTIIFVKNPACRFIIIPRTRRKKIYRTTIN